MAYIRRSVTGFQQDGAAKPVILLVNLGTPETPTAAGVRRFLREFLSDPMVVDWPRALWKPLLEGIILRTRPPKVAHMYESIWTAEGSPLAAGTKAMAGGLARLLEPRADVEYAYRYGRPGLRARLQELSAQTRPVVVVPLFPQRTASSSETILRLAERVVKNSDALQLSIARIAPDDSGYIEALADVLTRSMQESGREAEHLLISFHGIPARVDRGEAGLYQQDCRATAGALLDKLNWPRERATLTYQSRFGPERWLRPTTAGKLAELPPAGVRSVALIAPGFLTDGLETLEELGIRGRKSFMEVGGEHFVLAPAVAGHASLLASLAGLLEPHLQATVKV